MKNKTIHLKLPININNEDEFIFEKVNNYKIRTSKVTLLKNVFVTNNGFVLKNGILNSKSGLNLKSNNDHTFYYDYWKVALEQNIVCKFGKSLPSLILKDNTYLLIHSKWLNYSFWITEYLQRLARVEKEIGLENLVLLYPEEWDQIPYIVDSLSIFSIKKLKIPAGHHLFIKKLVFPETREITSYFDPEHIQIIRNRLLKEAKKLSQLIETPKKIYLTRGLNVKRAITNEEELQQVFKEHGFSIVSFEKLSIWDQIIYMNNADIVFTNHGAGFSNVIFMEPKKIALEFLERDFAYYANPFPHWKLANTVEVQYAYQLCNSPQTKHINYKPLKSTNGTDRIEHVDRNIIVDINQLIININYCVSKISS